MVKVLEMDLDLAAELAALWVAEVAEVRFHHHKQVGRCPKCKIQPHPPRKHLKHKEFLGMSTCHHLEVWVEKAVKVHANSHGNHSEHHH